MKKAGVITVHCADNYGSVLQALAMQQALNDVGLEAGLIDYRPKAVIKDYRVLFSMREIKDGMKYGIFAVWRSVIFVRIKNLKNAIKKKRVFEKFRSQYFTYVSKENLEYCFTGSDQLWNPDITAGFDENYFLSFANKDAKKIAYAVSIGRTYTEKEEEQFSRLIQTIQCISIREETQQSMVERLSKKRVSCVLDPTLLQDRSYWEKYEKSMNIPSRYILFYSLFPSQTEIDFVNQLSEQSGCRVLHFFYGRLGKKIENSWGNFFYESPEVFLYLIHHAEYVVTDSFHGTVFSILYKKEFYCFMPPKRQDRISCLLEKLNLKSRVVNSDEFVYRQTIDYNQVAESLDEERKKSWEFLRMCL